MAIQCSNEHVLQRISNQLHIAIRFRWADFDRALDDTFAGQLVFEHACQDRKYWQRWRDRKVDGPSYHWVTCRNEGCDGCCADTDSLGAALRGQLRSRYWGPFKNLLQTADLQADSPAALRALWP